MALFNVAAAGKVIRQRPQSVTVPEEKGNLNQCWGPAAPLFVFHMGSGLLIPLNSVGQLS